MESTESRFAHLLQPIRELTKNWDIDVASELNDYLEELDDMCITFDGGKTRLNFAEAALLIQGSACIYSKKVELLHSLTVDVVPLPPESLIPPETHVNVWTFHDPYSDLGEDKPLKPGKCYKVPDGLDEGGKRKRRRASPLQDFRSWFRGNFDPPEHKLKNGPRFTDLNYMYLSTMKDKLKTQRRICRKAGVLVSDEELRRTFLQPEAVGLQQGEEPVEGFRHPDLFGKTDVVLLPVYAQRDELSYEDLVKLRVDQLVVNCRGYTQETALSRRVKDWEEKIRPELSLQEERPTFDIRDYGDRIVRALNGVGHRRSFSSIVHGLDNFEACKYLLASLQLANDSTVDVHSSGHLDDSLDSMSLTLLSFHRATDRFNSDGFGLETAASH
uniref:Condensin-2 complex subunit H2 n=1 Tax=Scophthalmus maximus TaxID=52904 RepID=A0A8D3BPE7_SCOMX